MIKAIWPKIPKLLRWLIEGMGLWLLGAIFDSVINKKEFFKSLYSLPRKLANIQVPHIFFVIGLLLGLIVLVNFNKRFKGLSMNRFKEMLSDNQRMQRHNTQLMEQMDAFFKNHEKLEKEDRNLLSEVKTFWAALNSFNMKYRNGVYWSADHNGKIIDGPFCPLCFDKDKKAIHLSTDVPNYYKCANCGLVRKKTSDLLLGTALMDKLFYTPKE